MDIKRYQREYGILFWIVVIVLAVILIMALPMILMIVSIGLLIWLIIYVLGKHVEKNREKPLDILKKRYAAGKITKKQFDKMKKDLK